MIANRFGCEYLTYILFQLWSLTLEFDNADANTKYLLTATAFWPRLVFRRHVSCQEKSILGKMNQTYIDTSLTFPVSKMGLITLVAQPVFVLRAKLLKVVIMVSSSFGTLPPRKMSSHHFSLSPHSTLIHLTPFPKNVFHI